MLFILWCVVYIRALYLVKKNNMVSQSLCVYHGNTVGLVIPRE